MTGHGRDDSPPEWAARRAALSAECLDAKLAESLSDADAQAIRGHRRHKRITLIGVTAGAVALLLGIVQLGEALWLLPEATNWPARILGAVSGCLAFVAERSFWAEVFFITVAALAVIVGWFRRNHESWLYWRYRAERFRSLPFEVMIDPCLWRTSAPTPQDWKNRVHAGVEEIDDASPTDLHYVAEHESEPKIPEPSVCADVDPTLLKPLTQNYLEHRLRIQTAYFRKFIDTQERNRLDNPTLLPFVFFVSVSLVFVHIVIEAAYGLERSRSAELSEVFHRVGSLLLFASAAIPAIWTAIRTWRSANESSRNVARSRAKLGLLNARAVTLEKLLLDKEPDAFRVFTLLALCESLLHNELQEWLRLMLDAEWYG